MDAAAVEALVAPAISSLGLEIYDVEVAGESRAPILRVKVDRAGGVDMDAVTEATRALSDLLDEHDDLVAGKYTLEVASPGLERELRRPVHFARARGETVTVKARTADGPVRVKGVLRSADDAGFTVAVDGTDHQFAYDDITSVRTVFDWESKK